MAELLSGSTVGGFLIASQNNDNAFCDITATQLKIIKLGNQTALIDNNGNFTTTSGLINSEVANSSSQIGFTLKTLNYTTQGQKLFSIKNNDIEKFSVDKDGNITSAGIITQQLDGKLSRTQNNVKVYNNVFSMGLDVTSITGTIKITLPKGFSRTMFKLKIDGFEHQGESLGNSWSVVTGGYNYTDGRWINYFAQIYGNAKFDKVRLGFDTSTSKCVILIGETTTVWNYPQINISEVLCGYQNYNGWDDDWNIDFITDESSINSIYTPSLSYITNQSGNFVQKTKIIQPEFQINDSHTQLTQGYYKTLKVSTPYGYTEIGQRNNGYSHFYTDLPQYYFDKPLQIDANVLATTFSGNGQNITNINGSNIQDGTITNNKLANSTISGVQLGSSLGVLTLNTSGTGLSGSTTYNGSGTTTFTVNSNATNQNTPSTIVARDQSGNFSAGTITQQLSGNQSTATKLQTQRSIQLTGQVTGSQNFDGSQNVSIVTTVNHNHTSQQVSDQTNANTANMIVKRDQSGNFSAGTITQQLSGNQSTATKLQTQRTVQLTGQVTGSQSFDGSQNVSISTTLASHNHTSQQVSDQTNANTANMIVKRDQSGNFSAGTITATKVYGAVYNDYQEYRNSMSRIEAGYVCIESENGNIELCKKDRQKNIQGIQSDTYGTIMGDSNQNNTPVSVQGRVLVYADNKIKLKIGDQVCATKNGKIRKMKWYEKILFPEQIVGIVSEFPTYETWGTDNIAVNNRIWLNIRR